MIEPHRLKTHGSISNTGVFEVFDRYGFKCIDITNEFPPINGIDVLICYTLNGGEIFYFVDNKEFYLRDTSQWCGFLNMSDEDTLYWAIKYGNTLPNYIEDFHGLDVYFGDVGV